MLTVGRLKAQAEQSRITVGSGLRSRTRVVQGAGLEPQQIADPRIEFKPEKPGDGKKKSDTLVPDGPRVPISTPPTPFAHRPPPRFVIPRCLSRLIVFGKVPLGGLVFSPPTVLRRGPWESWVSQGEGWVGGSHAWCCLASERGLA